MTKDERNSKIISMAIAGNTNEIIANECDCSVRTVRRVLSENNIIITIVMYIKTIVHERSGNVGDTTIEYVATIIPAKKIYIFLFIFCFL